MRKQSILYPFFLLFFICCNPKQQEESSVKQHATALKQTQQCTPPVNATNAQRAVSDVLHLVTSKELENLNIRCKKIYNSQNDISGQGNSGIDFTVTENITVWLSHIPQPGEAFQWGIYYSSDGNSSSENTLAFRGNGGPNQFVRKADEDAADKVLTTLTELQSAGNERDKNPTTIHGNDSNPSNPDNSINPIQTNPREPIPSSPLPL